MLYTIHKVDKNAYLIQHGAQLHRIKDTPLRKTMPKKGKRALAIHRYLLVKLTKRPSKEFLFLGNRLCNGQWMSDYINIKDTLAEMRN